MRLAGKAAIVVGAGQSHGEIVGNGRATALLFACYGAKLLLVDRDANSLTKTAELVSQEGGTCLTYQADATDEDACRALTARCLADFGRIDVLHKNVGNGAGDSEVSVVSVDAWDRTLDVNLKSTLPPANTYCQ